MENKEIVEKGVIDLITKVVNNITGIIGQFGEIKDVYKFISGLLQDKNIFYLALKIYNGDNSFKTYILLVAEVFCVLKIEILGNNILVDPSNHSNPSKNMPFVQPVQK
jgi:hypothetical protein